MTEVKTKKKNNLVHIIIIESKNSLNKILIIYRKILLHKKILLRIDLKICNLRYEIYVFQVIVCFSDNFLDLF